MKTVTILALHLGIGGIEKTLISVANMLSSKYKVEILSTYQVLKEPAFFLNDNVKITYLLPNQKPNKQEFLDACHHFQFIKAFKEGILSLKLLYFKKAKMIKAIKECQSDVIISTRVIYNRWLGKYGNKQSLKIGWEHNHHNNDEKFIQKIVDSVQGLDKFVLVSEELRDFYQERIPSKKCYYIPNALSYFPKEKSTLENKRMISVGRLSEEKGFSDLIEVFYLFHKENPDWTLDIIGDGFERKKIEEKIKDLHLEHFIHLHGAKPEDYVRNYLKNSSIYVLPSFSESFGIVILEAYSFGIPVVAFDSASGARALVKDNKTGFLISNRDKIAMKNVLLELAQSKQMRLDIGNQGRKESQHYLEEEVQEKWFALIEERK